VHEPAPGKSRAIARGVSVAGGDVLALTDDDVDVEEGWLDAIRAAMDDPSVALVGGPVAPRWERTPPRWLRTAADAGGRLAAPLALLNYGDRPVELAGRTAIGANLAVRRESFQREGGFAAHLGKLRGTLLSGEDHELCRRIERSGERVMYNPNARVRHFVPAERMRIRYYVSWFFWSGIAHAAMDGRSAGRTLLGIPLYLFRRVAAAAVGAVASALSGNAAAAVERGTDVAFAAGYASCRWRLPITRAARSAEDGRR
jgi:GT2 family glycosyltransferase